MQSLIISQQYSLGRLEKLEDEVEEDEDLAMVLRESTLSTTPSKERRGRKGILQKLGGLSINTSSSSVTTKAPPTRLERASVWLGAVVFGAEQEVHPGRQVARRLSSDEIKDEPNRLLRTWTDQRWSYSSFATTERSIDTSSWDLWRNSDFAFSPSPSSMADRKSNSLQRAAANDAISASNDESPKSPRTSSIAAGQQTLPRRVEGALALEYNAMESLGTDQSPRALVASVLESVGATTNPEEFVVRLIYAGRERSFAGSDNPMEAFLQYRNMELNPRLFICRDVG